MSIAIVFQAILGVEAQVLIKYENRNRSLQYRPMFVVLGPRLSLSIKWW